MSQSVGIGNGIALGIHDGEMRHLVGFMLRGDLRMRRQKSCKPGKRGRGRRRGRINRPAPSCSIGSALGVKRQRLMRMMLMDGMWPAVLGLGMGLAASLGVGRLMRDLLYEIKPLDPGVFVSVSAVLLAVAAFACFVPARRASRLDPMQALRTE